MVKGFVGTLLTAAIALFIYLYIYLGAYRGVEFKQESRAELHLLFKPHMGAYHQIGETFKEVEAYALKHKIDCSKTFGEYLDDPSSVDQDRLRSNIGCYISAPPTEAVEAPFKYETRPARTYMVARFKGSPSIGPMKVYPKMREVFETARIKSDGAVIEVYLVDGSEMTTEYLFPFAR